MEQDSHIYMNSHDLFYLYISTDVFTVSQCGYKKEKKKKNKEILLSSFTDKF